MTATPAPVTASLLGHESHTAILRRPGRGDSLRQGPHLRQGSVGLGLTQTFRFLFGQRSQHCHGLFSNGHHLLGHILAYGADDARSLVFQFTHADSFRHCPRPPNQWLSCSHMMLMTATMSKQAEYHLVLGSVSFSVETSDVSF